MSYFLFKEALNGYKNIVIEKEKLYEINLSDFFLLNRDRKEFTLYLDGGKYSQVLPYEAHLKMFEYEDISEKIYNVDKITVETEKRTICFRTDSEDNKKSPYCLRNIFFTEEPDDLDELKFDFIKKEYLVYKDYDIEWCGEYYQVTDYMTKRLVSHANNEEQVRKDIDDFLLWKNKISVNPNYYKDKGINISVVSSGERYPAFPYTFELIISDSENIRGYGISNVFETKAEAIERACYLANDVLEER